MNIGRRGPDPSPGIVENPGSLRNRQIDCGSHIRIGIAVKYGQNFYIWRRPDDTDTIIVNGADITGNICSPLVSLLEGAKFNGKIDMSGQQKAGGGEDAPADKPAEAVGRKKPARKAEADRSTAANDDSKAAKKSADAA